MRIIIDLDKRKIERDDEVKVISALLGVLKRHGVSYKGARIEK